MENQLIIDSETFEIVVTIRNNQINPARLIPLVEKGATILRLNGAFLFIDELGSIVNQIRRIIPSHIKIILDLPGYKIRFLYLEKNLEFQANTPFILPKKIFNYPDFVDSIETQTKFRINDGMHELSVCGINDDSIQCISNKDGVIKKGKGLHLEGVDYRPSTYSLSSLDKKLIKIAREYAIDYVGLSFVYNRRDIDFVEEKLSGTAVKCIPKIESKQAVQNLKEILEYSEMAIIDRGDLSGEIGIENIWEAQREIISNAKRVGTKIIVATQLLTSMVRKSVPSIAEVDSLHGLLKWGIDGVQLSDETCIGQFPEEAVAFISDIAERVRRTGDFKNREMLTVMSG
jgi:pyruvate kinase